MSQSPYYQSLGSGLTLRTATDARDVARVTESSARVRDPLYSAVGQHLYTYHPHTQLDDLILVEDERTGEVVSSMCLIPWTWRCAGIEIPSGEMGIVGTLAAYRNRGLVRVQVELFKRRLHERGCLLSHIHGIPYFYRQFGYEYALPMSGGLRLDLRHVPDPPTPAPFTFCLATLADLPILMRLYDETAQDLDIHTVRDAAIWQYLLTHAAGTGEERDTWLIRDAHAQPIGYLCTPHYYHLDDEQVVNEVSRLGYDAALAALQHLKHLAVKRQKSDLWLNLPANSTLMHIARSLGAYDQGTYAWQIHIPDNAALLRALSPALERRIAESPFAGLTRDVAICLYKETIRLHFVAGRLTEVANLGFIETELMWQHEFRLPPLQFIPLVLGDHTWAELRAFYPDVSIAPAMQMLADTLFPKMTAFIYPIY